MAFIGKDGFVGEASIKNKQMDYRNAHVRAFKPTKAIIIKKDDYQLALFSINVA